MNSHTPHFSVLRILLVGFFIYSFLSFVSMGFSIFKEFPLLAIEQNPQKIKELIEIHSELKQKKIENEDLKQELDEKMDKLFNPYNRLGSSTENFSMAINFILSLSLISFMVWYHLPLYKLFYKKRRHGDIPETLRKVCKIRIVSSPLLIGIILPATIILGVIFQYSFMVLGLIGKDFKTIVTITLFLKIISAILSGVLMFSWQKYRVQHIFLEHVFFPEELRNKLPALRDIKLKLRLWIVSLVTILLPLLMVVLLIITSLTINTKPEKLKNSQIELLLGEYIKAADKLGFKSYILKWLHQEGLHKLPGIIYVNAINTPILLLGLSVSILMVVGYSMVLMFFFTGNIVKPLYELQKHMKETEQGNYNSFVIVRNNDEVGDLVEGYNRMLLGLEEREKLKNLFGQYLTREVSEEILNGRVKLGGDYFEATIMFSDIRDFTSMSEKMPPEEVLRFLNSYMERMIDVIVKHGGIIDKFMGDGILATFGVPVRSNVHSQQALLAALDMKKALADLNQNRGKTGLPPIRIGIGLHSGLVIAGNIGNSHKTEYTIIGDTVNLASRIEGLTKEYNSSILISGSTFSLLPDEFKDTLVMDVISEVSVRGKSDTVRLYKVN
ncbi:MAG: hypothetical protein KDK90_16080 [Leptospiraceae bacterium]|nr:hypothetical protein [Leptospiraceae bacterium]